MSETNAEALKRYRREAAERGLCYTCRCRFPRPGVRSCDECLKRVAAHKAGPGVKSQRRRNAAARKRRTDARKNAGLCPRCGRREPLPGYAACSICLDYTAASVLKSKAKVGKAPSSLACSVCGQLGHYAPRHERPGVLPVGVP